MADDDVIDTTRQPDSIHLHEQARGNAVKLLADNEVSTNRTTARTVMLVIRT